MESEPGRNTATHATYDFAGVQGPTASPPQHLTRLLVVPARLEEDDAAVQAFVDASAGVVPVGIGLEDSAVSRPL